MSPVTVNQDLANLNIELRPSSEREGMQMKVESKSVISTFSVMALALLLVVFLGGVDAKAASPEQRIVPFKGHYSANWNFTFSPFGTAWQDGDIKATHLGRGTHDGFLALVPESDGCLSGVDSGITFEAANGDELLLEADLGLSSACPNQQDPTLLDVVIVYNVVGGTGRFEGVTGRIDVGDGLTVMPDNAGNPGTFAAELTGVLILPTPW